ncbi:MAG TPA: hypothetical protein VGJ14_04055 [Sporichthyaceae bacterium]|jgi:hypothetical protein
MKLLATRNIVCLATVSLAGASVIGLSAGTASANDNRYSLTAQGDSQFYQVDGGDIPGSPQNTAGSLTAQAHIDSTGQNTSFASAPYYGNSVETLPGLVNGAPQQFGYTQPILPFSNMPGYVTASYPSRPTGDDANFYYKVHAEAADDHASAAGSNGAPDSVPAPNQQQLATAEVKNANANSTVANAEGAAAGFVQGPLEVGYSDAKALISDAGGAPKVQSTVFGRFSIGGQDFGYDKSGFTYLGQSQDKKAALDSANSALKASGMQLDVAPETTTTDPASGIVTYTLGGLKVTSDFTTSSGSRYTISYVLGRVQVSSVNAPFGASVASTVSRSAATLGGVANATHGATSAPTSSAPTVTHEPATRD